MTYGYANGIRYDTSESITNLKGWDRNSEAQYLNLRDIPRSHKLNDPHHWCMSCELLYRLSARRVKALALGTPYDNKNTPPRVSRSMQFHGIPSIWMLWRDHPETPYWRDGTGWVESKPTAFKSKEHASSAIVGGGAIGILGTTIPTHTYLTFDHEAIPDPVQLSAMGCVSGIVIVEKAVGSGRVDVSISLPKGATQQ